MLMHWKPAAQVLYLAYDFIFERFVNCVLSVADYPDVL